MDNTGMYIKQPTTYTQQLQILKDKGFEIVDEEYVVDILKIINYYRLSGYILSFDKPKFRTFEQVYHLYEFDRKLRNLLIAMLEKIEISFRSQIAYYLAHRYGPLGYENEEHFNNPEYHKLFLIDLNRELKRNNELFIRHYRKQHNGKFPIWVAIEVTSFGSLSKLFANLNNEDKSTLAKGYYGIPYVYIQSWLMYLSYIRNICAHYGRLYNRTLIHRPKIDPKDKINDIQLDKIYVAIFIMKKLIQNRNEWNDFITQLYALLEANEEVDEKLLGFPNDWEQMMRK